MPQKTLPVFNIEKFTHSGRDSDFYANTLSVHLNKYGFIFTPHKHDFFFVALCTKGKGVHTIDFKNYEIQPGSLFVFSPGQTHSWVLSDDAEGYIFFHTKDFFDMNFLAMKIKDYPFYCSIYNAPLINLKDQPLRQAKEIFEHIVDEYTHTYLMKFQKIYVLLGLLYVNLSRSYLPQEQIDKQNLNYLARLRELEDLVEANYKTVKSAGEYADMMHISEKHLNRICKECINKTTTDMIMDRIMLEAKRLLILSGSNVSEVAAELGYFDVSYFSRLFKKRCEMTPLAFIRSYLATSQT